MVRMAKSTLTSSQTNSLSHYFSACAGAPHRNRALTSFRALSRLEQRCSGYRILSAISALPAALDISYVRSRGWPRRSVVQCASRASRLRLYSSPRNSFPVHMKRGRGEMTGQHGGNCTVETFFLFPFLF